MGTDEQGRDLAARMIHGTRVSIFIGFIAVFIYISIGVNRGGRWPAFTEAGST
jgi:peptide/nickel transport system permease protein